MSIFADGHHFPQQQLSATDIFLLKPLPDCPELVPSSDLCTTV
jgi:hypothetical protein